MTKGSKYKQSPAQEKDPDRTESEDLDEAEAGSVDYDEEEDSYGDEDDSGNPGRKKRKSASRKLWKQAVSVLMPNSHAGRWRHNATSGKLRNQALDFRGPEA